MVPTITREQLKRRLEHGGNVTLVEVAPEAEYHDGHLPGAIHLPADHTREFALPDKEAEIVVYCGGPTCTAAQKAADELLAFGYSNVRVYQGGKQDWIDAGLPTEGGVPLATPY
jgi:rhodanese-related sulfurtransferase